MSADDTLIWQVRSYGLDPSLLVDLCRQSLVYETPSALCDGLAAILADPVARDRATRARSHSDTLSLPGAEARYEIRDWRLDNTLPCVSGFHFVSACE